MSVAEHFVAVGLDCVAVRQGSKAAQWLGCGLATSGFVLVVRGCDSEVLG